MSRSILNRSPLYVQIKQHILGDIRQGVWKPGEKLPTELDLAERFGVSVGTVRRAMGGLEDEGIISRREGSGTFVRTYKGTGSRNPFHIISGMDGKPRGTRKELVSLSSVVPPGFVSDALLVPRGKPVLLMVRKLWDDGNGSHELITVDESYLLPERFPGLTAERFRKSFREDDTLYKFYDREFGVVIIRQKCKVRPSRHRRTDRDACRSRGAPHRQTLLRHHEDARRVPHQPRPSRADHGLVRRCDLTIPDQLSGVYPHSLFFHFA